MKPNYYAALIAHRWFILLLCAAVGGGISTYKALTAPNMYRASSKLGIALKIDANTPQVLEKLNEYYENQLQYMRGGAVQERVAQRLRDYKSATGQMPQPLFSAQRFPGTSFFQMVVDSTEFAYAQRYAIAWAEEFLKFKDELRSKVIDKTATYILQEIRKTELTLEKNQADITEFQKQNNVASAKEVGDGQHTLENTKEKLSSSGSDTQTRIQQRYEQLKESEARTKLVLDNLRKTIDTINLTPSSEAQIEIVERWVGSPAPVGPKRARMILMGLFMGLVAGLGIVYFLRGLKGSDN